MSLFKTGIMPKWEDKKNSIGGDFQIKISGLKDSDRLNALW